MVCRLCLIDDGTITIFTEEKIQKCIAKYLQLELFPDDPVSKLICNRCWEQLDNFQNFCQEVERAQKKLVSSIQELKQKHGTEETGKTLTDNINNDDSNLGLSAVGKEEVSDDELLYNEETFSYLDVNLGVFGNESQEEKNQKLELETSSCFSDTDDVVPKRRFTRQSVQKSKTDDTIDILPIKKKRGRPKKNDPASLKLEILPHEENPKEEEYHRGTKEKTEITRIETEPIEQAEEKSDTNAKRKRGRPKKGEEVKPKPKPPRSEQITKMLQTAKELDQIIQKHMNLSCNICAVRLIDFAELKRHFRAVHQRRGYAVCCDKRLFKRGLVVDHINVHNNPEYFKCPKCGKILSDRMCLRNHDLLFHQTEELKTFHCPYCPKKYAKQYLLDHHKVKHVPQGECKFFCAECGKGYPTNATLTKHINQIHSTLYDKMCEICAKLIRGKASFERHMKEHEGIVQPQVQCTICGSWLKDKNSLRKHMYKHDGKTYICSVCDKKAPTKSALQSHMRYVHELSRLFHCTFCDKSFKKAVNLKEHLTTHTGEVLYTCPHCPKTFNSKANMHSHRKKKHREEWEANRRYPKKEIKNQET